MQLYPEIEVEHSDDTAALILRAKQNKWTWLFAGRTVYLVGPPLHMADKDRNDAEEVMHSMRILHSKNIAPLVACYVASNKIS